MRLTTDSAPFYLHFVMAQVEKLPWTLSAYLQFVDPRPFYPPPPPPSLHPQTADKQGGGLFERFCGRGRRERQAERQDLGQAP